MATRSEILKQLKDDMLIYITPSVTSQGGRKYLTDLRDVKRGVYGYDECNQLPTVCYTLLRDELIDEFGGQSNRRLNIYMYGYMNTKTYKTDDDAYDGIHDLVNDIEEFLYNDFTYKTDTEIGEIVVNEAGLNFPVSWFEITITILYSYTI